MPSTPLGTTLRFLLHLAGRTAAGDRTDGELLDRFSAARDESAFAALVERHGPMVLGACRRVLHDGHGAEDAFQATFLVLAQKAATLDRRRSLGSWLYTVALHAALKARAGAARRRAHERQVCDVPSADPVREAEWREVCGVLDAELGRLPQKYRAPLILCYLEGKTNEAAARELGWPPGSMAKRLTRARELLRERLQHRGVALPAGLLAALLAEEAPAAVPAPLAQGVCKAAALVATGQAAGAGSPPAALAERVVRQMFVNRLKAPLAVFLVAGLAAAGAGVLLSRLAAPEAAPAAGTPPVKEEEVRPPVDALGDPLPEGALMRFGTRRLWHLRSAHELTFSPDGKVLATSGDDGVRLWEMPSGKPVGHLVAKQPGAAHVYGLAFSPDGQLLAAAGPGDEARLWALATGKELFQLEKHADGAACVTFSPDGKVLATGDRAGGTYLWDVKTGKSLGRYQDRRGDPVQSVAFSPDGKAVMSHLGTELVVRDAATGAERRRVPVLDGAAALSPDGKAAASCTNPMKNKSLVLVHDLAGGEAARTLDGREAPALPPDLPEKRLAELVPSRQAARSLAFVPGGQALLAAGDDGRVRLWDAATGKELRAYPTREFFGPRAVAVSPDGKTCAAAGLEGAVQVWDLASGKPLEPGERHHLFLRALAFSPDGRTLATVDEFPVLRLWEAATGKLLARVEAPVPAGVDILSPEYFLPNWVTFSADGKALAAALPAGKKGTAVHVWEVPTGRELRRFAGCHPAFAPDGKTLAVAEAAQDDTLVLTEAATGKELRRLERHPGWLQLLAFSATGKELHAATRDKKDEVVVQVWDAATGKELRRLNLPRSAGRVAVSADGRALAYAAGGQSVRLVDTATGRETHQVPGECFAFSPDGRTLAAARQDRDWAVRLWDVATGRERGRFAPHLRGVTCLEFSPDGRRLVSGSSDTTVLLWDVTGRVRNGRLAEADLTPERLEGLWKDLGGADALAAHRAVWELVAGPRQAVPFLEKQVRPVPATVPEGVAGWIADLDSDDFAVRDRATAALEKQAEPAEAALRRALAGKPSLEARRRLEALLAPLDGPAPSGERLRALRAVEVLEQTATLEARQVLEALAKGAAGARLTREAQEALGRLAGRK